MTVDGACTADGHLRIEGKVIGNVHAAGLEVTQTGAVEGDVDVTAGSGKGQVFVIDGRINGRVRARMVEVRPHGSVLGGLEAEEAVLHGRVDGGIVARKRVAIMATAVVTGEVRTQRLSLEEGGQVNGSIQMKPRVVSGAEKDTAAA